MVHRVLSDKTYLSLGLLSPLNNSVRISMHRKPRLKMGTIKGKIMLPIGSVFFPLRVAPMRIENNFEQCEEKYSEKTAKINLRQYDFF